MSRKKNIAKYYQEIEKKKKKEAAKKRNKIVAIVIAIALVLVIAISAFTIAYRYYMEMKLYRRTIEVVLEMEKFGNITLELYPDLAPITVENFVNYVNEGFYDGLTFHRVIESFMLQGGDPTGTGVGDPSLTTIKGEFAANGVKNNLSFERGVIGMARGTSYDSASSQFFICHEDSDFLDGEYAAFGRVIDGMPVVDTLAACDKTTKIDAEGNRYEPAEPIVIVKAYVVD